jgi:uncharacterized protein (DUF427 family)
MSEATRPTPPDRVQHVVGGIRLEMGGERHVTVWSGETLLADSRRAVAVHEGPHPVRYYLPPEDVRRDLLGTSQESTYCPYKGNAVHYRLASGTDSTGIAWSYPVPLSGMEPIGELIAFYQERVKVVVEEPA